MTAAEILEGNKLIAEFMKHEEGYDEHGVWQPLQYHSSWDWLMPVCNKLEIEYICTDINKAYNEVLKQIKNMDSSN